MSALLNFVSPSQATQIQQAPQQQQQEIGVFMNNFLTDVIMNLVGRTIVNVATDDNKDIANRLASGLGDFFTNKKIQGDFKKAVDILQEKGIQETLTDPFIGKFVDRINRFYISTEGKALGGGARNIPQTLDITPEGANILYDAVSMASENNPNIQQGQLAAELMDTLENLFATDDIRQFDEENIPTAERVVEPIKVEDLDVVSITGKGFKPDIRSELKQLFLNYRGGDKDFEIYNYLKLYLKMSDEQIEQAYNSSVSDEISEYYKQAGDLVLQDNPSGFALALKDLNRVILEAVPNLSQQSLAEMGHFENVPYLTGVKVAKPQKRLRRTKRAVQEAKGMEAEDTDAPKKEEKIDETPKKGKTYYRSPAEMRDTRGMEAEDKKLADTRRREPRRRMLAEGVFDSPLRRLGRRILSDRDSVYRSPLGFQQEKRGRGRPRKTQEAVETKQQLFKEGGAK